MSIVNLLVIQIIAILFKVYYCDVRLRVDIQNTRKIHLEKKNWKLNENSYK